MQRFLLLQATVLIVQSIITSVHGNTENVKITQISFPDPIENTLTFCWEELPSPPELVQLSVLKKPGGVEESSIDGQFILSKPCAMFMNNEPFDFGVGEEVAFVLRLFLPPPYPKTDPDGEGMVRVTWPDLRLGKCDSANYVETKTGALRVHYITQSTAEDYLVVNSDVKLAVLAKTDLNQDVVYHIFQKSQAPVHLQICRDYDATINGVEDKISFCRDPVMVADGITYAPEVSQAQLEYSPGKTIVTVEPATGITSDKFEVFSYQEEISYQLSDVTTGDYTTDPVQITCNFDSFVPGTQVVHSVVFGYNSLDETTMLEFTTLDIQDYKLQVEIIFTTMIEMQWEVIVASKFHISITCVPELSDTFTSADVDCKESPTGCYGYFLDIPTGSVCTTVLQPEGSNELNRIASTVTTSAKSIRNFNELQIKDVQMTWQQEDREASTRVCFKHASHNVTTTFSHYEFVIVNNLGKWLKHKLISQDTEGDICFSPFSVYSETFDITEGATLVVTQRAEDGLTVLASGETHIKFN